MKIILCIGDSNTWGYDPRSWFGSQYPEGVRWTSRLESAGWQVCNCGQNGMPVPEERMLPVIKNLIRSKQPVACIMIMLGSNDLFEGRTAKETAGKMKLLLDAVAEAAPQAKILLIAPPAMQPGEWIRSEKLIEESGKLAECYRELANKERVAFADAESWGIELAFDGAHFTEAGHQAFAEGIKETLEKLL